MVSDLISSLLIIEKVTQRLNEKFSLESINVWDNGVEGEYNFSHFDTQGIQVLDKMLVNNIEICDLLIEEDNKVYFVHVKDGLDGDVRVLVSQIEHAMRMIHAGTMHNNDNLTTYYESVLNKIGRIGKNNEETTQSKSARKFKEKFSSAIIRH